MMIESSISALTSNFITRKAVKLPVTSVVTEWRMLFLILIMLSGRISSELAKIKK